MRSMSLFQLVGGVAVAGAVAAGTTAFTAGSGIDDQTGLSATALYGGASFDVVGATVDAFVISSSTNDNDVDKITLTLMDESDAAFADHTKVAVTATVTASGGTAAGHAVDCSWVSGNNWKCIPHTAAEVWNGITKVNFVVTDV